MSNINLKSTPLVSIIMNCYNGEKYLKEAIDSIYAQTYENWEIIFWDNFSTDQSAEIAKSYDKRLKYFCSDETVQLGVAREQAMKQVTGKYLCFLDTDDIWFTDKLSFQVKTLELNQELKLCHGGVYYIDDKGKIIGNRKPRRGVGFMITRLLKKYDINMQTVMIRFDHEKCYFNTDREYSPDHELFMRIACEHEIFASRKYLAKYRKVKNSLSHDKIDRWWIEQQQTLDMVLEKLPTLKMSNPKEISHALAKVQYYKALYHYSKNEVQQARKLISGIKYKRFEYFILYIISMFPRAIWDKTHKILNK